MAEGKAPACILLRCLDQKEVEVGFKIKKSTPLGRLMDAYCSRFGLQASRVRFMVDGLYGERIEPHDTAEKLGLEDEDIIDVIYSEHTSQLCVMPEDCLESQLMERWAWWRQLALWNQSNFARQKRWHQRDPWLHDLVRTMLDHIAVFELCEEENEPFVKLQIKGRGMWLATRITY